MKHIILIILTLALLSLPMHAQESLSLGQISAPYSKELELTCENESDLKIICFTLQENADVELCLDQAEGDNCLMLYDQEENYVTDNVINNSTDDPLHTKTFQNLAAGSYQICISYHEVAQMVLTVKVMQADYKKAAHDLGMITEPTSISEEVDMTNSYAVFHGQGEFDAMAVFRFETTTPMDFDATASSSSGSVSKLIVSNEKIPFLYRADNDSNRVAIHVDGLEENVYYVSVGNADLDGVLQMDLNFTKIKGDTTLINDSYGKNNYIVKRTFTDAEGTSFQDQIVYYDGMGRESECVQKGFSPTQKNDLLTIKEYDNFGRLSEEWLPGSFPSNNGAFVPIQSAKGTIIESNGQDASPYTLKNYESSPRNFVVEEYGTGHQWHINKRAIRTECAVNIKDDPMLGCFRYSVSGTMNSIVIKSLGQYPTGALTIKSTWDEDNNCSYNFMDEQDHVVLSRKVIGNEVADTYYIYDAWGQLLAVLPPLSSVEMCLSNRSWSEQDDMIAQYAYLYVYDEQFRQIGSKLPGCDWVYTLYDNAGTPVFTQNGEQRIKGEWSFVISDVWGRPCLEGICKNALQVGTSLSNTSAVYSGASTNYGYTINGITLTSPTVHKTTFYDNYDFLGNTALKMENLSYATSQDADYNTIVEERSKGKETGCISAINGRIENAIKSVTYYDYRGRAIQTNSTNHLGGLDKLYMAYDFTDHVIKQRQVHSVSGKSDFTTDLAYTYDHAGRLLTTTMSVNNGTPTVISNREYDELGRLVAENRNGNEKLRTTYGYNIRQWTKSIGGKLFNESLFYNESHNGATGLYNGNISAMDWSTGDNTSKTRGYGFDYDNLARLTSANYYENGKKSDNYSTSYNYDLMGNIEALTRNGLLDDKSYGKMDDLAYEYNGNQVTKITDKVRGPYYKDAMHFVDGADAEIEYEYNKNGCMTKDLNKNISKIEYNLLNLPTKLSFEDGSVISYSYDADGNKLSADYNLSLMNVVKGTTSNNAQSANSVTSHRDYCGNFIYEDGALKMMLFDGGYVTFNGTDYNTPQYHFYLKDHLGNNRVVADADGNIEQVNHYYPFGGLMAESTGDTQHYKYNGKELDRMHGLDCYDYGARMYDPCGIRWFCVDSLCAKYCSVSPYAYCSNAPIRYFDEKGKEKIDALPPNDRKTIGLRSEIESFRDVPNIINIWGHGVIDQKMIKLNKKAISNAAEFKKFLDKNSLAWQNRDSKAPITIVLHVCASANFAKDISKDKIFKNVTIVAPTTPISILYGSRSKNFSASYLDNNGIWMSYKDGKSIKGVEYGKYDHPGSVLPRIGINLLKILTSNIGMQWERK